MPTIKDNKTLNGHKNKMNNSNSIIYGVNRDLEDESTKLGDILNDTNVRSLKKYGKDNYSANLDFYTRNGTSDLYKELAGAKSSDRYSAEFKEFMEDGKVADIESIANANSAENIRLSNYLAINKHIPECAKTVDILTDSIISPDDFSMMLLNVEYDGSKSEELTSKVKEDCRKLQDKYELAVKIREIVRDTLIMGRKYVAVLSLDKELGMMLNESKKNGMLRENFVNEFDMDYVNRSLKLQDMKLTEDEIRAVVDYFGIEKPVLNDSMSKAQILQESTRFENNILDTISSRIEIVSKTSLMEDRILYENDRIQRGTSDLMNYKSFDDIDDRTEFSKGKKNKVDNKPLYLSGSIIKTLDPRNTVALESDNMCLGYYSFEFEDIANGDTSSANSNGNGYGTAGASHVSMNTVGMYQGTSNVNQSNPTANKLGTTDAQLNLIADIFLKAVSQKIDKEYVRKNKKFKDYIYSIVKQDYLLKKKTRITYFAPEDVVDFKMDSVYKDITYFAKLYLAELTNLIMIHMTRAHDKRIYYVNTGLDGNAMQAISNTVHAIKSKNIQLDGDDISTVMNINFGFLDDVFVPMINGNRPFEVDTLQGMDIGIQNNEFLDWLRRVIINKMDVPANQIDNMSEVDYSRTIASQNGNTARAIIYRQAMLVKPFSRLMRLLYDNEYKYHNDSKSDYANKVNVDRINVSFTPPVSLLVSSRSELLQQADSTAEIMSRAIVEELQDQSNEELRLTVKAKIIRDYVPSVEWDKYIKYAKEDATRELTEIRNTKELNKDPEAEGGDDYGGGY